MSKLIQFDEYGPPEVLHLTEFDPGPPGPGEVLLRQTAIGVNYLDIYVRRGDFGGDTMPGQTGFEAAGVIEEIGPDVNDLSPGDRIAYQLVKGAYAARRVLPTDRLVKLPDAISDDQAAAIMLKGMTASYLIKQFCTVSENDTILVHAAAGGVGSILTQRASHLGARVIGTVGSSEKAEQARMHGADRTIVYTHDDFVEAVNDATDGKGVDIAYDGVGKATFNRTFDCLAQFGTNVLFGWASGEPEPIDVKSLNSGSHQVASPSLGHFTGTRKRLEAVATDLFEAVENGAITVDIGHRYPLAEAARAHADLEARRTTGSIILKA